MTINITLSNLANLQNETTAISTINANSATTMGGFTTALNTTGDQMQGTLDMNSNEIINLPTPGTANSPLRLSDLINFQGGGTVIFPTVLGGTNITVPSSTNATYTVSTVTGPNFTNVTATSAYVGPAGGIGGGVLIVHTSANENLSVQSNINATSGIALTSIKDDNATLAALELNASQVYLSATTPMVAQGGITISSSTALSTLTAGSPTYGAYGTNAAIAYRRAEGSSSAPSSVTAGAPIGNFGWQGYVTSSAGYTPSKARFQGLSLETSVWTATSQGCGFEFDTTASGSISRAQAMRIMAGVYVGTTTNPAEPGSGNLVVAGNITATGIVRGSSFTGAVPVESLNSGSGAASNTFWRGDGAWVAPAGSAYTFLASISGSSLASSSIFTTGNYSNYEIVFQNLVPSLTGGTLQLLVYNSGTTSVTSYQNTAIGFGGATITGNTVSTYHLLTPVGLVNNTSPGISGTIRFMNPSATTGYKNATYQTMGEQNSIAVGLVGGGYWNGNTGPIQGFSIGYSASTTIVSGTCIVYGLT